MKAFTISRERRGAGLILLLTEKWPIRAGRAQANRYPDSEPGLAPAFPLQRAVAIGSL